MIPKFNGLCADAKLTLFNAAFPHYAVPSIEFKAVLVFKQVVLGSYTGIDPSTGLLVTYHVKSTLIINSSADWIYSADPTFNPDTTGGGHLPVNGKYGLSLPLTFCQGKITSSPFTKTLCPKVTTDGGAIDPGTGEPFSEGVGAYNGTCAFESDDPAFTGPTFGKIKGLSVIQGGFAIGLQSSPATGGTWIIQDVTNPLLPESTPPIPYNAVFGDVQTAMQSLSNWRGCTVVGDGLFTATNAVNGFRTRLQIDASNITCDLVDYTPPYTGLVNVIQPGYPTDPPLVPPLTDSAAVQTLGIIDARAFTACKFSATVKFFPCVTFENDSDTDPTALTCDPSFAEFDSGIGSIDANLMYGDHTHTIDLTNISDPNNQITGSVVLTWTIPTPP